MLFINFGGDLNTFCFLGPNVLKLTVETSNEKDI